MRRTALLLALLLGACGDSGPGTTAPRTPSARPVAGGTDATEAPKTHPDEIRGEMSTASYKDFEPSEVVKGGRVVLPLLADVDSFNPYLSTSAEGGRIHDLTYLRLLEEQADYHQGPPSFTPLLADRYEIVDNTIRYHIRDEALWSDGHPVTSKDVRFTWLAARNPDVGWASASIVDHITDVEIVDPKNLVIHFKQAYPDMLMDSKDPYIVPEHVFGKIPFEEWKSYPKWDDAARVVSGWYKVDRYQHNEEFVLVPNEKFWDRRYPRLDVVHFRVIRSRQTAFDALLTGELDGQATVLPENAKRVLEHPDLHLYSYMSRIYYYVGWNCKHWIFQDPVVRKAMTHAIDREDLVRTLFYGYAKVTASPIISSMWASDRTLEPHPFDPEEAQRLLASRGWTPGPDGILQKDGKRFTFTMSTNSGNEIRMKMQQILQANFRRIGVNVELTTQDFNSWAENLQQGREDAWIGGWNVATKVDPKPTFHSEGIGHFNYCQFSDPRVDDLIDRGRIEPDREKALAIWKEFQALFHEIQPYSILCEPLDLNALRKRFRNVEMNSLTPYFNIWEWFVPEALQRR